MALNQVILPKRIFRDLRWMVATNWLKLHPEVEVIGITGSVGKTSCKEIISSVLAQNFKVLKTKANFDPIFILLLTILKIKKDEKVVAEMGVDGFGQMDKYLTLVRPRLAVLTCLSLVHADADHFGSLKGVIREKIKLLNSLPSYGWAIVNGDDKNVRTLAKKLKTNVLLYGFDSKNDLKVTKFKQTIGKKNIISAFEVDYGFGKYPFNINLPGRGNVMSALSAIGVGMLMGLSFSEIQAGLSTLKPVWGRLQVKNGRQGELVINDTYNASPEAVRNAIDVLASLSSRQVLVLGEMLELGRFSAFAHQSIGEYAGYKMIKKLIVLGENASNTIKGYLQTGGKKENVLEAKNHQEIAGYIKKLPEKDKKIILVKGSRGMKMEKVVDLLT